MDNTEMIKTLSEQMTAQRDLLVQEITITALTTRMNILEQEKLATNANITSLENNNRELVKRVNLLETDNTAVAAALTEQ
jgi:uncharacterized FlgJ-related protein